MPKNTVCPTEFRFFQSLVLEMAQQRTLDDLLGLIVHRLDERHEVALARIWLTNPGDICETCIMRPECEDQQQCLHLMASAGRSATVPDEQWSRCNGRFRRFPMRARKVGHIAATGEPVIIHDMAAESAWNVEQEWVQREGIRTFHGQPIMHRGDRLGVLAVFARAPISEDAPLWLRMIADHVAAAIVSARAFEEIQHLKLQLELENTLLRDEILEAKNFGQIIGQSPAVANLAEQIELVAPTDANVLISGESGTGKELVACEIHRRSHRRDRPMVRVNCASIPRDLYESEFFGHVKGAFTGAVRDRAGRFQAADGGTLFLDEVGEIPLEMQSKLLRVLQEGEYERVGEEDTRKVNVRIIAATNRKLVQEIEARRFRQDLYYRLNVFPIDVVPLRYRKEDIPLLAAEFLTQAEKRLNCRARELTQGEILKLQRYDWPGNIRELQNVIERAVIASRCGAVKLDVAVPSASAIPAVTFASPSVAEAPNDVMSDDEFRRRERSNIELALKRTNGKIYGANGAAELLGVKPTTLVSRIKKMGIRS